MEILDSSKVRGDLGGAAFPLRNKLVRVVWGVAWLLLCRWTPPPLHGWRCAILRLFGARVGKGVRVWSDASVWLPSNLILEDYAQIGRRAFVYNQSLIRIGYKAVISWEATLCASTHDFNDPYFQLFGRPIEIGAYAWVAAQAFVGPGVVMEEGAVLGARGAATRRLSAWTVYGGNPAAEIKLRDRDAVTSVGRQDA